MADTDRVQVCLVRHGDAVDETRALPDPARHLSTTGRLQARALGERLRWHDCTPPAVWTSPLVRAVQTAELVVAGLAWVEAVTTRPELGPGGDLRALAAELAVLARAGDDVAVVLVGHEPGLSGLGALLTRAADFDPLRKAEAVRLDHGRVRWRFGHDDDAPRVR